MTPLGPVQRKREKKKRNVYAVRRHDGSLCTQTSPVQTHVHNVAVSERLSSLAGATHHSSCLHKWAQCTVAEL